MSSTAAILSLNSTNVHHRAEHAIQSKKSKLSIPSSPPEQLRQKAEQLKCPVFSEAFARAMDAQDPLGHFREEFKVPRIKDLPDVDLSLPSIDPEAECCYFAGNSLGLMPKETPRYLEQETKKWSEMGVYGHMRGELPWVSCDECCTEQMAKIVGALPNEVAIMNGLTVNLHLLLSSFYRPTQTRHKILIEAKAFPSDHYAVESQIRYRGFEPSDSLLLAEPRQGEETINQADLLELIRTEGDSIALMLLPGVQYYTGQLFDMEKLTRAAKEQGIVVGWDMAHAAGNVELKLHEWDVDFAVWCTYKYLSAGAGSLGGAFMHEKHDLTHPPTFQGWWSHKLGSRFEMNNEMELQPGIRGYRMSNPSMLCMAAVKASMEVFDKTSMKEMRKKSLLLTAYLELLILEYFSRDRQSSASYISIMTPKDPNERGCQLSLSFSQPINIVHKELTKYGIVCDERKPNVIRVAPHHLYNSYLDCYRFVDVLRTIKF